MNVPFSPNYLFYLHHLRGFLSQTAVFITCLPGAMPLLQPITIDNSDPFVSSMIFILLDNSSIDLLYTSNSPLRLILLGSKRDLISFTSFNWLNK